MESRGHIFSLGENGNFQIDGERMLIEMEYVIFSYFCIFYYIFGIFGKGEFVFVLEDFFRRFSLFSYLFIKKKILRYFDFTIYIKRLRSESEKLFVPRDVTRVEAMPII